MATPTHITTSMAPEAKTEAKAKTDVDAITNANANPVAEADAYTSIFPLSPKVVASAIRTKNVF